jgi:hypothetical protein
MTNALKDIQLIWDRKVSEVLTKPYIAKMVMPLNTEMSGKGIGMTRYKGLAYAKGYGGRTSFALEFDVETPDITQTDYNVPKQFSSRTIKRDIYESFLLDGIPIGTDMAVQMLSEVQLQQNATVVDGWKPDGTNYAVLGMYQVANNSAAGSSFGSYGGALATVSTLIGLLQADDIYSYDGYNLIVNPTQKAALLARYSTTGIEEYPQVVDLLNIDVPDGSKPGRIIPCSNITAGTCIVAPTAIVANRKYFELIEAQTPYNNLWWVDGNSKDGDIKTRMVSSLFPTFKHLTSGNKDDCIAIGTAIT